MKGLLKFITCGSVDDGKSTLIGHILYDSKLLYADQEKALELDSKVGSREGEIDYSLLLDGLMAEREQGITIDVAYRYFTTNNRSFIVADTPGHEEYTRNMAVGASFADLAIILVDAKQGVLIQTKRHARICTLMGIRNIVFAINKMDLVGYSEEVFRKIESQISDLTTELGIKNITLIPVSATEGDNVTTLSKNTKWYHGKALLPYLEEVDIDEDSDEKGFYMPVQRVCRPNHEFRGFQGQVEAGSIRVGDEITSLPSNETAHVKSIYVGDCQVDKARKGQPITIQLDKEVDVSRGCVLSIHSNVKITSSITATILWMDDSPLNNGKIFLIKVGTKMIPGRVTEIVHTIDVNTGNEYNTDRLNKNEIAVCKIDFTDKIVTDEFTKHKTLGELILIDRITDMTSACGVVNYVHTTEKGLLLDEKITKEVRARLNGQYPVIVEFPIGRNEMTTDFVQKVEQQLSIEGKHTYLYQPEKDEPVEVVCKHLNNAGLIVLLAVDEVFADKDILKGDSIYYRNWQSSDKLTVDEAVQYIKKIAVYKD